ncbi:hypothetical protein [Streptomyces monomycini]|uniref:hypothetical protein n=1 Tax=Streptomyces monomycini TaxID=371720 RepID=UPI0004AB424D|nr:hypothetical protein [Streptomyces monomycini]
MEAQRVAFSLIAALAVPAGLHWHKKLPWHAVLFSLVYASLALLPTGPSLEVVALLGATALLSFALALLSRPWPPGSYRVSISLPSFTASTYAGIVALLTAAAVYTYTGIGIASGWLAAALRNDQVWIFLSGGLTTVFGSQRTVAWIVKPQIDHIESRITSGELSIEVREFIAAAAHIGWLERVLLFAFLVSGKPEAAALVVAAKSFIRAPGASQGGKLVGDYYLVGTLASVGSALLISCATRIALGLSPL